MLKEMIIAGAGGFIGTSARYAVSRLTAGWAVTPFPIGTFAVNMLGCLLIGVLAALAERGGLLSQNASILLITGVCGGFTTFSTFSNEMLVMLQSRQYVVCGIYFLLSVLLGVALVWVGRSIVH